MIETNAIVQVKAVGNDTCDQIPGPVVDTPVAGVRYAYRRLRPITLTEPSHPCIFCLNLDHDERGNLWRFVQRGIDREHGKSHQRNEGIPTVMLSRNTFHPYLLFARPGRL